MASLLDMQQTVVIDLIERRCEPLKQGISPLTVEAILPLRQQLQSAWKVVDNRKLRQAFVFDSFMDAMVFVNDIAALAEDEGHHPDMSIQGREVVLELTTHDLDGLSENDFILARKVEVCC